MSQPHDELEQARWEALIDREAVGEPLDPDERAFVQRHEAAHPELAHERTIFEASISALREPLDVEHDPAALERDAAAALDRYRREIASPAATAGIRRGWWIAGIAAAAGLAAWIGLRERGSDDPQIGARENSDAIEQPRPDRASNETQRQPIDARPGPAAPVDPVGRLSMLGGTLGEPAGLELGGVVNPGERVAHQPGDPLGGAFERACVSWSAPTAVVCFEGAVSMVDGAAVGERKLRLESGRLVAALAPLGTGQRFTVETWIGTVSAIGTVFAVEIHEGHTWVTVLEGRVELRDPTVRALSAGQRTSLRGEVPGDEPAPLQADVIPSALQELVSLAQLLRSQPDQPGQATLIIPSTHDHTLQLDGHALDGPAQLLLAAGEHTLDLTPDLGDDDGETSTHAITLEAGAVEDLHARVAAAAPSESDGKPSGASKTPSAKQLADAAQRERELRHYKQTAALYRELLRRYPDSPEASSIPVRLGDLLASTGDHQGALEAYEAYLERGAKQLAPEAEFGRIQALGALGREAEERVAIEAFIAKRPKDYRRAQLEARLTP